MRKLMIMLMLCFIFTKNATNSCMNTDIMMADIMERIERQKTEDMVAEIEYASEVKIPKYVDMKYIKFMYDKSKEYNLPLRMVFRLVFKESTFRDTVVSPEGAKGFMQVMPKTYELYSTKLRLDTVQLDGNYKNILVGMNLLKDLYEFWEHTGISDLSSWKLTLACYNAGKGNVLLYQGVPPFEETINYIDFILKEHTDPNFYTNNKVNDENQVKNRT